MSNSNVQLKDNQNLDYSYSTYVKLLVNNEEYSDVSFSVGEKEQLIYGHKMVLASGSPVMKQMFYGNLAEKDYPIRISDITPNGFINMLRYMYGYEIDFDLSNLYDVYVAADKYLVHNLTDKIFKYIKSKLNVSNYCLIYDQLLKIDTINNNKNVLDHVRSLIIIQTKDAISSECFKEISKKCLIDILNIPFLSIDEIDILRSCLNWIETELIRNNQQSTVENKRSIFNEIKPFIRFSKITIQQLIDFKRINSLLNSEEIGNLFLHLTDNQNPIPFECKTSRKLLKSFYIDSPDLKFNSNEQISEKSVLLNTNQEIYITHIFTCFNSKINNLVLNIYNDKNELINVKQEKKLSSNKSYWNYEFVNFKVVPNVNYKISFKFDSYKFNYFSDVSKLETNYNNTKIIINLNFENLHCIAGIDSKH